MSTISMSTKPLASLSLDLDNKWAYLHAAGDTDWETCGSYFGTVIPRIIESLGSADIPLTVFLVGRDLQRDADVDAIQSFDSLRKWEAANHSLNHLPWMHTMSDEEIDDEISVTHDLIFAATDRRPVGFRGPGFSCPDQVLKVLSRRGYRYDASIFPTSMAPIARAVFLMRTQLQGEQREKAKQLYGGFAAMRKPNQPYVRFLSDSLVNDGSDGDMIDDSLWEIPVTVMPFLRTPIHFSYLTFLASINIVVAKFYFRTTLAMCRRCGVTPSLLLHPPDFLGCEDDTEMAYLPGMKMPRVKKLEFMNWALTLYAQKFDVRTMIDQLTISASDKRSTFDHARLRST